MTGENQEIFRVLLELKEDVGSIKADVTSIRDQFEGHLAEDKVVEGRVTQLEVVHNKQSGAAKVWSMLGTAIGALLGFLAAYFGKH